MCVTRSSRGPEFSSQHSGAAHNCLGLQLYASGLSGQLYPHTREHTHKSIFTKSGYRKGVRYKVGERPSHTPETSYERPLAPRFKGTINQTRVGRSPERSSGDKTPPGPTGPENRCIPQKTLRPKQASDLHRQSEKSFTRSRVEKMAHREKALAALTKDPNPAPTQQVTAISNSSSGESDTVFWPHRHQAYM